MELLIKMNFNDMKIVLLYIFCQKKRKMISAKTGTHRNESKLDQDLSIYVCNLFLIELFSEKINF